MVSNAIDVAEWGTKRQIAGLTCLSNRKARTKEIRAKEILEKEKTKAKLRKEKILL